MQCNMISVAAYSRLYGCVNLKRVRLRSIESRWIRRAMQFAFT